MHYHIEKIEDVEDDLTGSIGRLELLLFTVSGQQCKRWFQYPAPYTVRIYDGLTRKLCKVLEEGDGSSTTGHTNRVFGIKWNSLDTHVILSGGWDKTIQVWDLRVGKSVRSIFGPYLCGDSLDFDDSTSRILTGSWRAFEQLQEWDYGSGSLVRTFVWPQSMNLEKPCQIYSACYGRNMSQNLIAAGGSGSNQASLFHAESGHFLGGLHQLGKGVVSISFNHAGSQMCIVTTNQVFMVNMQDP